MEKISFIQGSAGVLKTHLKIKGINYEFHVNANTFNSIHLLWFGLARKWWINEMDNLQVSASLSGKIY